MVQKVNNTARRLFINLLPQQKLSFFFFGGLFLYKMTLHLALRNFLKIFSLHIFFCSLGFSKRNLTCRIFFYGLKKLNKDHTHQKTNTKMLSEIENFWHKTRPAIYKNVLFCKYKSLLKKMPKSLRKKSKNKQIKKRLKNLFFTLIKKNRTKKKKVSIKKKIRNKIKKKILIKIKKVKKKSKHNKTYIQKHKKNNKTKKLFTNKKNNKTKKPFTNKKNKNKTFFLIKKKKINSKLCKNFFFNKKINKKVNKIFCFNKKNAKKPFFNRKNNRKTLNLSIKISKKKFYFKQNWPLSLNNLFSTNLRVLKKKIRKKKKTKTSFFFFCTQNIVFFKNLKTKNSKWNSKIILNFQGPLLKPLKFKISKQNKTNWLNLQIASVFFSQVFFSLLAKQVKVELIDCRSLLNKYCSFFYYLSLLKVKRYYGQKPILNLRSIKALRFFFFYKGVTFLTFSLIFKKFYVFCKHAADQIGIGKKQWRNIYDVRNLFSLTNMNAFNLLGVHLIIKGTIQGRKRTVRHHFFKFLVPPDANLKPETYFNECFSISKYGALGLKFWFYF